MRWNKAPVLTASLCSPMEDLRTAIEVLTGKRTRFLKIDFNTGKGAVLIGDQAKEVMFIFSREDLIRFDLGEGWCVATFEQPLEAKVLNQARPSQRHTVGGDCTMRWVGLSATERREEPLFLKEMEYCAQVRGLSLEELLNPTA